VLLNQEQSNLAREAAGVARDLISGFYALRTALDVAGLRDAQNLIRSTRSRPQPALDSVGKLKRRNGAQHEYSRMHYLKRLHESPQIAEGIERSWLAAGILQLGELLAKGNYFDRSPELELFRHLRNGVAHGNVFSILASAKLDEKPAHNRSIHRENPAMSSLEITHRVNGTTVLFEFMDRADVLNLFFFVGAHLSLLANDDKAVGG
jgi:hypothetical protein